MTHFLLILNLLFADPKPHSAYCERYFIFNRNDTAILVSEYQDCKVYISSFVSYREQFSSSLKEDTVIASYFKTMIREPASIVINDIQIDPSDNQSYILTIFAFPQNDSDTGIIKRILLGASRMKYRIKTALDINPIRIKILHIELAGNQIQM